ncbi:glycosyltransferase family 4 protein [Prosthecochloris vibrioformis]|nr:glycosyltransferase family 4 protein [Prosthecochloris vibrioformis]
MGDIEEIENYLQKNGEISNVRFIAIRPSLIARLLNSPNRKGFLVYSFYLAYKVWHRQAARKAQSLLASESFDLVHYLCPIGYREPGFLWQFDIPYVWGPIGGMVPTRSLNGAPRSTISIWKTRLKNLTNAIQLRLSRRVPKAIARADKLVAATSDNAEIIKARFGRDPQVLPENAIPNDWIQHEFKGGQTTVGSCVRLIWIGSLDARKSPDLLIDALKRVSASNWHIDLIGDGSLRSTLVTMIAAAGLGDKVTLTGLIPRSEVKKLMKGADLHIITSMNEANPTVLWEAMASGVPTISLEHCGMRDTICGSCGVLIPMSDYQETCDLIASEIDRFVNDSKILANKKSGVLSCAETHLWSNRANTWLKIYNEAIESHLSNKTRA